MLSQNIYDLNLNYTGLFNIYIIKMHEIESKE